MNTLDKWSSEHSAKRFVNRFLCSEPSWREVCQFHPWSCRYNSSHSAPLLLTAPPNFYFIRHDIHFWLCHLIFSGLLCPVLFCSVLLSFVFASHDTTATCERTDCWLVACPRWRLRTVAHTAQWWRCWRSRAPRGTVQYSMFFNLTSTHAILSNICIRNMVSLHLDPWLAALHWDRSFEAVLLLTRSY